MNPKESTRALFLSTMAFAVSFAVWGMVAPIAKSLQSELHLSEQQVWLLIAVPVLLGAAGRLPMGTITDRYGGRIVYSVVLIFSAIPAVMLSFAHSYTMFLVGGALLGVAGSAFPIGVGFVSKWYPPAKQGFALGVYGAGNIGQSLTLILVPLLSASIGWQWTFRLFAALTAAWGVVFYLLARNAPVKVEPKPFSALLKVFVQPMAWVLALFYFLTFGGFVALSISLPKVLQEVFHLSKQDAGVRVAVFVLLATLMRPIGGILSDRVGGARVLQYVFILAGVLAVGTTFSHIVPFTIGALGAAICVGLGNGAVFKLVPQTFPRDTATVTGLVGAMGGLGGFFPPLMLGVIKTQTGSYAMGFLLFAAFCAFCFALNYIEFHPRPGHGHEHEPLSPTPQRA